MTCTQLLYVGTDVNIPLEISEGAEFQISDVADLEITMTRPADPLNPVILSMGAGDIDIDGSGSILMRIKKPHVENPGDYKISIRMTDQLGKFRGITPCPDRLTFHR